MLDKPTDDTPQELLQAAVRRGNVFSARELLEQKTFLDKSLLKEVIRDRRQHMIELLISYQEIEESDLIEAATADAWQAIIILLQCHTFQKMTLDKTLASLARACRHRNHWVENESNPLIAAAHALINAGAEAAIEPEHDAEQDPHPPLYKKIYQIQENKKAAQPSAHQRKQPFPSNEKYYDKVNAAILSQVQAAQEEYSQWWSNAWRGIGFFSWFHHHGEEGQQRAKNLSAAMKNTECTTEMKAADSRVKKFKDIAPLLLQHLDRVEIGYFSQNKGRLHPHSFDSILLKKFQNNPVLSTFFDTDGHLQYECQREMARAVVINKLDTIFGRPTMKKIISPSPYKE